MLNKVKDNYILKNPISMYEIKGEKYDNLFERLIISFKSLLTDNNNKLTISNNNLNHAINNTLTINKNNFLNIISKLEVLNPLLTIKRGYSVVRKDGKVITKKNDLNKKDKLELELSDGNVNVEVL